jgi:hypothetical protein
VAKTEAATVSVEDVNVGLSGPSDTTESAEPPLALAERALEDFAALSHKSLRAATERLEGPGLENAMEQARSLAARVKTVFNRERKREARRQRQIANELDAPTRSTGKKSGSKTKKKSKKKKKKRR